MGGEAAALGSALLWAISSIMMGAQSKSVPPLAISALRLLFGALFAVVVVAVAAVVRPLAASTLAALLMLALSGVLSIGVGDSLYIASLDKIGVSRAFPITGAIYPLLTLVLAVVLLDEAVSFGIVAGTLLIIAGVYLIVVPAQRDAAGQTTRTLRSPELRLGFWLALAAAALWAVASVLLRVYSTEADPLVAQAVRLPAALVVTALIARSLRQSIAPLRYGPRMLSSSIISGLLGTGVGSLLFITAVQQAGAAKTAVLSSTAPLFALPLAALMLGERVTLRLTAGAVLSIIGIWLVV